MNEEIINEAAFAAKIDLYGETAAKIKAMEELQTIRKIMIESYAKNNGINRFKTDLCAFAMKAGTAALKKKPGLTDADVVALLMKNEVLRGFVAPSFDAAKIKAHVAALEDPNEFLVDFGLRLTEPGRHLEIRPRK